MHAGIYDACWYLRCMLVFTMHAGIYDACWYLATMHAGIYDACWYLRCMLIFALHAGIYDGCWYLRCMLIFALHACLHLWCMLVFIARLSSTNATYANFCGCMVKGKLSRFLSVNIRMQSPEIFIVRESLLPACMHACSK